MKPIAFVFSSFLLLASVWGAPSLIESGTFIHLRDNDEEGAQEDYFIRAESIEAVVVYKDSIDDKPVYKLELVTRMLEIRDGDKSAAAVSRTYRFTCSRREDAQKLASAIIKSSSAKARQAEQPATRPVEKPEDGDKPQPEAEGHSR